MIKATEIKDKEALEAWLTDWPASQGMNAEEAQRVAVTIAHRAAMRVLPLGWNWFIGPEAQKRDLTALPILRCNLSSAVVDKAFTPALKRATAASADSAAFGYSDAADAADSADFAPFGRSAAARSVASAAAAARSAAVAAAAVRSAAARSAAAAAARSAAAAAAAAARSAAADSARSALWSQVQKDAALFQRGDPPLRIALWYDDANPFAQQWDDLKMQLAEDWSSAFWLHWYEAALTGVPLDQNILMEIALIPDEDWEKGPAHIARMVGEVLPKNFGTGFSNNALSGLSTQSPSRVNALAKFATQQNDLESALSRIMEIEEKLSSLDGDALRKQLTGASTAISALRTSVEQLSNTISSSEVRAETVDSRNSELLKSIDALTNRTVEISDELEEQFKARFEAALAAFREEQAVKEPVKLWEDKREEHLELMRKASNNFLLGILFVALMIIGTVLLLTFGGDSVAGLLQPAGCNPDTKPELCDRFSIKGLIVSASFLTLVTLALWFTRLQMKVYLSERHLALDSRERKAFAQAYIGLLAEDSASQEAREQRALVYTALFRPSSDGIIKEEGGLDPSITAALSKLLSR